MIVTALLIGASPGQSTERVSLDSLGAEGNQSSWDASISGDGRYVAFSSYADNLVSGDTNAIFDVFVHDRETGVTERVSVSSSGTEGNASSTKPFISFDGRFVAYESWADNLASGITNQRPDVFLHDRQAGTTIRVSLHSSGSQANNASGEARISVDGRFVAFSSSADNLVSGDTNGAGDVFIHDLQTGATECVSLTPSGIIGNKASYAPSLSDDGRFVAFQSDASNLVPGDTNGTTDIFVHDRQTSVITRASVNGLGVEGNRDSSRPSISADGRFVAFQSRAENLVTGDTNGQADIFVHDLQTGKTKRASVSTQGAEGNGSSGRACLSSDGRFVNFESKSDNLVPKDMNSNQDVFVHDLHTGMTERISVDSFGLEGNGSSQTACSSADGRFVAFDSLASNLVAGDSNWSGDVFVHDRWSGLGANSVYLTGPATAPVGAALELAWENARPNSRYGLAYSMNTSSSFYRGHAIDIGNPRSLLKLGFNTNNGMGSYTSAPVPNGAAGRTVYFELVAIDAGGMIYDSNALAVTFQ